MLLIPIGISVFVQIAANDGLRLIPLSDNNTADMFFAAYVGIKADEVDEIRAV